MRNIKIGIEIEGVYNGKLINIEKGEYHDGIDIPGLDDFTAEDDSTIHGFNFDGWDKPVEIVSRCFKSKSDFFKGLRKFQDFFSGHGKRELNQILFFNSSCGSHVHFSIRGFRFGDKTIFNIYPKVRNYFVNKIRKSSIKSKHQILAHYDRSYSRIVSEANWRRDNKYLEFNLSSEEAEKGIEWRSLNMLDISTWKEFFEFWEIVYLSIAFLYKSAQKWKEDYGEEEISELEINQIRGKLDLIYSEKTVNFPRRRNRKQGWTVLKVEIPGNSNQDINLNSPKIEEETISCVI